MAQEQNNLDCLLLSPTPNISVGQNKFNLLILYSGYLFTNIGHKEGFWRILSAGLLG
jgi:hypothetical protein